MEYKNLEKVMRDYGRELAEELQRIVPVKTGHLKNSINFKGLIKKEDGFELDIEALYYFTYLDKGTKFIVARNYLDKAREKINNKMGDDIKKATTKDIRLSLIKELNK
jgi:hypothetical protein